VHKTGAQNLLSNGGFESYSSCPSSVSQMYLAYPWIDPVPATNTAEYFNECSPFGTTVSIPNNFGGYQYAKNGKGYAGINTYVKTFSFRCYIQSILTDTLITGEVYCLSFYVNCANKVNYAIDAIGAYVSKTAVTCGSAACLLNYIPQVSNPVGNVITDTANWTKISGSFVATGGEKYITIGNFKNNASTDTVKINTLYQDESYYYIDSVTLMLCSDTAISVKEINNEKFKIKLFPNPSNGTITLNYTIKQSDVAAIKIYDLTGKLITDYKLNASTDQMQINNADLNNGIYMYDVIVNNKTVKTDKLVIIKQ
jgi:hypothetical protein